MTGNGQPGVDRPHETGAIDGPLGLSWNTAEFDFSQAGNCAADGSPELVAAGSTNAQHGLFEVAENVASPWLRHLQHHVHQGH